MTTTTRRTLAAGTAALCLAGLGGIAAAPGASADDTTSKVLLVLDLSGSMNEKDASGQSKIDGAKAALKRVIADLPDGTQVGLRVYGNTIDASKETNPKACQDSTLVSPIAALDRSALTGAVDSFRAVGETPMAYSLEQGVKDLGTTGNRTIVLVSDGEERCVPDPCATAQKLAAGGVNLQFNAIGLAVDEKTRSQLQCIATAGKGAYYDVADAASLAPTLTKISTRTARGFAVQGQRINATQWETDAPTVGAGQYVVTLEPNVPGTKTERWVKFRRSIPGSTVRVAMTSQLTRYGRDLTNETIGLATTTVTPDAGGGRSCESDSGYASSAFAVKTVTTAVTILGTETPPTTLPDDDAQDILEKCEGAAELYVKLSRQGSTSPNPMEAELLVIEEPPLTSTAGLAVGPPSFASLYVPVAAAASATPVVGGAGFSDAAEIGPGSHTETISLGETAYYKVRLEPGQQAVLTAETPASPQNLDYKRSFTARVNAWSPGRFSLAESGQRAINAYVSGNKVDRVTAMTPSIEWTNRTASSTADPFSPRQMRAASMAGWYYFSVNLDPGNPEGVGHPLPVRVSLQVNGQPSGPIPYSADTAAVTPSTVQPQQSTTTQPQDAATTSPGATATAATAGTTPAEQSSGGEVLALDAEPSSEGLSPAAWVGGGVGTAALLGLVAWFMLRRRPTS